MRVLLSLDDPPLTMEDPYVSLYNATTLSIRRKRNGNPSLRGVNAKAEAADMNRKGLPFGKQTREKMLHKLHVFIPICVLDITIILIIVIDIIILNYS